MADQAVNVQATEPEVAQSVENVMADAPQDAPVKAEENGEAKTETEQEKESTMLKTKGRLDPEVNNSKYDPSVLPVTDDPQQIRVQVWIKSRGSRF